MVKHVIIWQLKDELSFEQKQKIVKEAKKELEALFGNIEGLIGIRVQIEGLETSNGDMLLDSSFLDYVSLKNYSTHPLHVAVADKFIRPYVKHRLCMDYEI